MTPHLIRGAGFSPVRIHGKHERLQADPTPSSPTESFP